jgi:1-acyl-sn-glycerol-3-phosphate acyltransferase
VLYAFLKPFAVAIMRLLFRLEGRGMTHVPAHGPVLLVANHSSFLDPPLVGGVAPRQLSFMAKAELFKVPLFGGLIRRLNARPVRREGADASALRTALRILQDGDVLLMFPEGTRGDEGTLREPKPGAAMLAVLSGAAVVPVFIQGSGRAWPRGQSLPRPAKVIVTFGPPTTFGRRDAEGRKTDYDDVSRAMMAAIGRLASGTNSSPGTATGSGGVPGVREFQYIDGRNGRHGEG